MGVVEHFSVQPNPKSDYSWYLASQKTADEARRELARTLAVSIMQHNLRGAEHLFLAWDEHLNARAAAPTGTVREALRNYVTGGFGLPERPANQDHMQGYVVQYLWYFIACEQTGRRRAVRVESPPLSSLEHGADGLSVHGTKGGGLRFILWEIKKHSTGEASSTISQAYSQLEERGARYLAQLTALAERMPVGNMRDMYSRLPDHWIDGDDCAGAGVFVGLNQSSAPGRRCFSTFPQRFPRLAGRRRLLGVLAALHNVAQFSDEVRAVIWTGL
ncbi:MAG: hypothetical protein M0R22_01485 [Dehalococcoidia bacterium]|nr:hypothetical protein [Dehalococcoidia bacterium]